MYEVSKCLTTVRTWMLLAWCVGKEQEAIEGDGEGDDAVDY